MTETLHNNIFKRTLVGVSWVFIARAAAQILSAGRWIVLSWMIRDPNDWGLMAIALLTLAFLETFTETGFIAALIQKPTLEKADLDSTWSISLFRGMGICVAMCLIAPLVARFFEHSSNPAQAQAAIANHDLAVWVIRAFSLTIVLRSLTNIGIVSFRRELQFNKLFVIDTTGLIADVAVAVVIAILYRSVWALVIGKVACETVRAAMSYAMHPFRPSFAIDRDRCDQLWRFGKWMFWSTVFFYFLSQGDGIFVGRVLGWGALGLYLMAGRYAAVPATEITNVISQVTFPAYSLMQNDLPRLRDAYIRVLKATAFLSLPIAGGIIILAPDFVRVCLASQWQPIIPVMQLLAVNGAIMSVGSTMGPAFQAIGKPRTSAKLQLVKLAFLVVLIYPLTKWWGISGTAIAVAVSSLAVQPVSFSFFCRMTGVRVVDVLRSLYLPLGATIVFSVAVVAISGLMDGASLLRLASMAIMAGVIYLGLVLAADRYLGYGFTIALKQHWSRLREGTAAPQNKTD
jgi:lipopolysaccharide exporter